MLLGNVGLRLVPNEQGILVGKRTETLERQVPTEQSYDSAPVYKERTFAFRPRRGLGEQLQSSHASGRYRYGLNVWVQGGLFGKGPLTHTITPAATGQIADFIEGQHGGLLTQFTLAGRYVLRRVDDSNGGQVISRDFGAGLTVTSGIRFRGAYAGSMDALYVTTSNGQLWQYNGAAWAQAVLPAGFLPTQLELVGDELWAADTSNNSVVRKVTGDPLLAAQWGGPILVGNQSQFITAIRQVDNRLFIFKTDGGIFTLNGDGSDNDLFPGLKTTWNLTNGQNAAAWLDALWLRIGDGFYRLEASGGASIEAVGPERLLDNTSEVRGPVQAFAGYGTIAGFAGIYNSANGASYLLSYGDWQVPTEASADARSRFVDQWDGALVKWAGKQISAMRVTKVAIPDTRLYVGFTDGTWDWIKLVPHPLATDSGAEFTMAASTLYCPVHHAMFQADWKNWRGFSVFGPNLDGNNTVQLRYRTDPSAAYTVLGGAAYFTRTAQRIDPASSVVGMQLDLAIDLISTSSASTPLIEGVAIHEQVRPRLQLDLSGSVDARDYAARRDGSTSHLTGDQIREAMFQAASVPGTVTLTLPDETYQGLSIFSYQERMLPQPRRAWVIDWAATQYRTITLYGNIGRLKGVRISDLIGVRVSGLKVW